MAQVDFWDYELPLQSVLHINQKAIHKNQSLWVDMIWPAMHLVNHFKQPKALDRDPKLHTYEFWMRLHSGIQGSYLETVTLARVRMAQATT